MYRFKCSNHLVQNNLLVPGVQIVERERKIWEDRRSFATLPSLFLHRFVFFLRSQNFTFTHHFRNIWYRLQHNKQHYRKLLLHSIRLLHLRILSTGSKVPTTLHDTRFDSKSEQLNAFFFNTYLTALQETLKFACTSGLAGKVLY